ncbi:MAG: hypothetical protein HY960_04505 [Ignavibacteriae bacterium]|nr:hypothetical protein [Ignavibacteriota bacterium]
MITKKDGFKCFIGLCSLSILFFSCATIVEVRSNFDVTYKNEVKKMLIEFGTNHIFNEMSTGFYNTFKQCLDSSNIDSKIWRDDGLTLEEDLKKVTGGYEPDLILLITQREATLFQNIFGATTGTDLILNATIYDAKNIKRIWRGDIDFKKNGRGKPNIDDGIILAQAIAKRLEEDKVIVNFKNILKR